MNWLVLYTKPQQELKVLERLQKIDIEAYCPVVEETRRWSDRQKKVIVPLIKSYVFVRVNFENRLKVFDVPGVVRYLFWMGKPAVVYDHEIVNLKRSLNCSYSSISIEKNSVGSRIKINDGPFKDKEGTVLKVSSKYITIVLEQLGITVSITY